MPSYSPEDNVKLLIACVMETEQRPDYDAVALRLGLPSARAAGDRVKKLIKDAEKTMGGPATPSKTPGSGRKRERPANAKTKIDEETPTKKKKAKAVVDFKVKDEEKVKLEDDEEDSNGVDDADPMGSASKEA